MSAEIVSCFRGGANAKPCLKMVLINPATTTVIICHFSG